VQLFCLAVLQSDVLTMFYCLCSRMLNKKMNKYLQSDKVVHGLGRPRDWIGLGDF